MLAKRLFQLYSMSDVATIELQWLKYLKLVFLKIPNVTIWSVFQNQVTYAMILNFVRITFVTIFGSFLM